MSKRLTDVQFQNTSYLEIVLSQDRSIKIVLSQELCRLFSIPLGTLSDELYKILKSSEGERRTLEFKYLSKSNMCKFYITAVIILKRHPNCKMMTLYEHIFIPHKCYQLHLKDQSTKGKDFSSRMSRGDRNS